MVRFKNGTKVGLKSEFGEDYPKFVDKTFIVKGSEQTASPTLSDVIFIRDPSSGRVYRISSHYFEEVE